MTAVLLPGCATVLTPIPRSEYKDLTGNRTLRVTTTDGDWRDTSSLAVRDSTLIILKPRAAMHDPRPYPVSYRFSEIQSVSTIRQESLIYVESGVEHGEHLSGESPHFSETIFVIDLGYLSGERRRPERPRWGFGGTVMTVASFEDFRMGAKARVRYRFHRDLSVDATAGPMLKSWNDGLFRGFVGGVNVNAGSFLSLRTEYMAYDIPAWTESNWPDDDIRHSAGQEKSWYYGVAFRGTMGWVTASVGSASMFVILFASLAALGSTS